MSEQGDYQFHVMRILIEERIQVLRNEAYLARHQKDEALIKSLYSRADFWQDMMGRLMQDQIHLSQSGGEGS